MEPRTRPLFKITTIAFLLSIGISCHTQTTSKGAESLTPTQEAAVQDSIITRIPGYYDGEEQQWIAEDGLPYSTDPFYDKESEYATFSKIDTEGNTSGMGLINRQGEVAVQPLYDFITMGFSEDGLCFVGINDKKGAVNRRGETVIPLIYDDIVPESNFGLLLITNDGLKGLIDLKGKVVIPAKYKGLQVVTEDLISFMEAPQKWGYIDYNDKLLVEGQFGYSGHVEEGKLINYKDGDGHYIIHKDGTMEKRDK